MGWIWNRKTYESLDSLYLYNREIIVSFLKLKIYIFYSILVSQHISMDTQSSLEPLLITDIFYYFLIIYIKKKNNELN